MLQHSKFVNTKTFQKAGPKKGGLQFPVFSKSVPLTKERMDELSEQAREKNPSAAPVEEANVIAPKPNVHPSVDLDEMQRKEDLNKKDKDWLSFFMGMTPPVKDMQISESTSLVPVSFASSEFSPIIEPLMTPPPAPKSRPEPSPAPAPAPAPIPVADWGSESKAEPVPAPALAAHRSTPPLVPDGPNCLDQIFDEMISEDKIFKRSAS